MIKKKLTYRYSYWLSQNEGATWDYYLHDTFHSLVCRHIPNTGLAAFYATIRSGQEMSVGPWLAIATRHLRTEPPMFPRRKRP